VGGIVLAVVLVGGGFLVGMNMGKAQAQDAQNAFFASRGADPNNPGGTGGGFLGGGANGAGGTGGGNAARRGAAGTITAVNGNTITVMDTQSQTLTIQLSNSTTIMKTVAGTPSDLTVGANIVVVGDRSGNNIIATTISLGNGFGAG